jgi:hypothetical protein
MLAYRPIAVAGGRGCSPYVAAAQLSVCVATASALTNGVLEAALQKELVAASVTFDTITIAPPAATHAHACVATAPAQHNSAASAPSSGRHLLLSHEYVDDTSQHAQSLATAGRQLSQTPPLRPLPALPPLLEAYNGEVAAVQLQAVLHRLDAVIAAAPPNLAFIYAQPKADSSSSQAASALIANASTMPVAQAMPDTSTTAPLQSAVPPSAALAAQAGVAAAVANLQAIAIAAPPDDKFIYAQPSGRHMLQQPEDAATNLAAAAGHSRSLSQAAAAAQPPGAAAAAAAQLQAVVGAFDRIAASVPPDEDFIYARKAGETFAMPLPATDTAGSMTQYPLAQSQEGVFQLGGALGPSAAAAAAAEQAALAALLAQAQETLHSAPEQDAFIYAEPSGRRLRQAEEAAASLGSAFYPEAFLAHVESAVSAVEAWLAHAAAGMHTAEQQQHRLHIWSRWDAAQLLLRLRGHLQAMLHAGATSGAPCA